MSSWRGDSYRGWRPLLRVPPVLVLVITALSCGGDSGAPESVTEKYQLSDDEARAWEKFYVAEAETTAAVFWGLIGNGRFEEAELMIQRFGDARMLRVFRDRIENLWFPVYQWPAASFTEEPEIGLGPSETVGFRTWGELWSGGFQRAVLAEDSITVYFVFSGYWQTESIPLYAAVSCGDFGVESPQWRPFPVPVFSIDASEPAVKVYGRPVRSRTLDEFCDYLRKRTFGSFGI